MKSKKFVYTLAFLTALLIFVNIVGRSYRSSTNNQDTVYGVSFSPKVASEYGNDWRLSYLSIIQDLGIKHVRLNSYWNEIEPVNNYYEFEQLDWLMETSQKNNVKVTLAVGDRQPRWPECHAPDWTKDLSEEDFEVEILQFIEKVVDRYKTNPALTDYQLENEAYNRYFGICRPLSRSRFVSEFKHLKKLDNRNINTNVSDQSGIPIRSPIGDEIGLSVYRKSIIKIGNRDIQYKWWFSPSIWHSARAGLIKFILGRDTYIHELQSEPWGPKATYQMEFDDQEKYFQPSELLNNLNFAEKTGIKKIYLWGGEWWYYRKSQGDSRYWNVVKEKIQESNQNSGY